MVTITKNVKSDYTRFVIMFHGNNDKNNKILTCRLEHMGNFSVTDITFQRFF